MTTVTVATTLTWDDATPCTAIYNIRDHGAVGNGTADDAPAINAAIQAANSGGGGVVYFPAGAYLIRSSISLTGCSNITLQGTGWGSKILAAADLDGSDNLTKNDIIAALNFTGPVTSTDGYPHKNIVIRDLLLDGTLQNPSGIVGAGFGRSLAGIEFLNVDFARVYNVKFVKCFGNGLVFGTEDPRQTNGVYQNGLRGCVAEDNVFDNCIRGLLPQYASATAPDGITGTVMQAGATYGCVIRNNIAFNPGGPFLDIFNADAADVSGNKITGTGTTPVGASPLNATLYQQTVGTLRSDFGLKNSTFENNTFENTGGVFFSGNMGTGFFNGNVPTPGPQNCTIRGNKIINPTGNNQIAAPAIGASGATYTNPNTQSTVVIMFGGTGLSLTYRRGTNGAFGAMPALGPQQSFVLAAGDAFTLTYSTAPTWAWTISPNACIAGITLLGGGIAGVPGQTVRNIIEGNHIVAPGQACIAIYDGLHNQIRDNHLEQPGIVTAIGAIQFLTAVDQSGGGCQSNTVEGNYFLDQRSPVFMKSNFEDILQGATHRTFNNRILNNRLENSTAAPISFYNPTNLARGNYGPGWKSPVLGAVAIPGNGVEKLNPFPYDCHVFIGGGTITAIAVGQAGATQVTGFGGGTIPVRNGEAIKLTYSVAPTVFNWFAGT